MWPTRERRLMVESIKRMSRVVNSKDPMEWIVNEFKEQITSFRWSAYPEYKDHVWDGTPDPFERAMTALAEGKWVGIESCTGSGKTWTLPRIVYWYLDVFPNSLVVTTAPKRDQLKEVLWKEMGDAFKKFKRIRTFAEMKTLNVTVDSRLKPKNLNIIDDETAELQVGHSAIGFVSSVGAGEESATKMQGFHRQHMLFVLEEAAGLHPAVMKAIENTCVDPGTNQVIAVGNPDSQTDALHEFCQKNNVEHIVISGYDHPNVVCNKTVIPGAVTRESLELRKEEYGEFSNFYKSRARGIAPTESVDSLVKKEWLDNCTIGHTKFKHSGKTNYNDLKDGSSYNALGVDVANSIDGDKACVVGGEQNICNFIYEFQCKDASHLAYNLIKEDYELMTLGYNVYGLPKYHRLNVFDYCIGVDAVGVGVSTVNTFKNEGVNCIALQGGPLKEVIPIDKEEKPLYNFSGLRSQMYFMAAVDLQKGEIVLDLPVDILRSLIKEMTIIKYKVSRSGIQVEDKEAIKQRLGGKSPNIADAFVYWNWMRKGHYSGPDHLPFA